jgi:hypothetical protein
VIGLPEKGEAGSANSSRYDPAVEYGWSQYADLFAVMFVELPGWLIRGQSLMMNFSAILVIERDFRK